MKISLVGPSYTSRSVVAAAQQCMNLYPEAVEEPNEPRRFVLYARPGLQYFTTMSPSKIRGMWAGGGRLFVINGGNETEVHQDGSITVQPGTVASGLQDPDRAQIFSNGHQLLVVSGGYAYCDNGAGPVQCRFAVGGSGDTVNATSRLLRTGDSPAFTTAWNGKPIIVDDLNYIISGVTDPDTLILSPAPPDKTGVNWLVPNAGDPVTAVSGGFLDGYFIVNRVPAPGTPGDPGRQFALSALNDGTIWDPLDFGVKEGYGDYINSIHCDHEELWLFGHETTEVWTNVGSTLDASGVVSFPFQRIPGAFIHDGSVATYAPCSVGSWVCWLGGSPNGETVAYRAQAFQPERISTHAQEQAWNAPHFRVNDATSYTWRDGGHLFWVLNFWQEQQTWVYDLTTGLWHERAGYNAATTTFLPYQAWYHVFLPEWGDGMHIVGDPRTGKLYRASLDYYDDDGAAIQCQRAFPHLLSENKYQFHHRFELFMDTGTGDASMLVGLDWSDDRGHTFAHDRYASPGASGNTTQRVAWRRLGKSRDRVYRIGVQARSKIAIVDAFVEATPGTS